ncbi:MAG: hypothetical protein JNM84_22475 [Planctomycetes bacterium]|nr:hypothetical protein [Planctomycetota bacterium]
MALGRAWCEAAESGGAMDQRVAWIGGAVAVGAIVAGALWFWSGEGELERSIDAALRARENERSAPAEAADGARRSAPLAIEPDGRELRSIYREAVAEYEAANGSGASAGEKVHDREMAIEALAQQIDRPAAGDPDGNDLLAIGARLEAWFGSDVSPDVRDAIVEALAPQRSAITGRVLWKALADEAEAVRQTARFHVEDILGEEERDGGEARRLLLERARSAAADVASPQRGWAQQFLAELAGGEE